MFFLTFFIYFLPKNTEKVSQGPKNIKQHNCFQHW